MGRPASHNGRLRQIMDQRNPFSQYKFFVDIKQILFKQHSYYFHNSLNNGHFYIIILLLLNIKKLYYIFKISEFTISSKNDESTLETLNLYVLVNFYLY